MGAPAAYWAAQVRTARRIAREASVCAQAAIALSETSAYRIATRKPPVHAVLWVAAPAAAKLNAKGVVAYVKVILALSTVSVSPSAPSSLVGVARCSTANPVVVRLIAFLAPACASMAIARRVACVFRSAMNSSAASHLKKRSRRRPLRIMRSSYLSWQQRLDLFRAV